MALSGTRAMCKGKITSGKLKFDTSVIGSKKLKDSKTSESGMDFESDWTKHRKSSAFTAQAICFATSFMPWSRRIPISEGFREFL